MIASRPLTILWTNTKAEINDRQFYRTLACILMEFLPSLATNGRPEYYPTFHHFAINPNLDTPIISALGDGFGFVREDAKMYMGLRVFIDLII